MGSGRRQESNVLVNPQLFSIGLDSRTLDLNGFSRIWFRFSFFWLRMAFSRIWFQKKKKKLIDIGLLIGFPGIG
jgi:hypothetical protein